MAKLLNLQLGAKREVWRSMDSHSAHADDAFQAVRGSVLERDEYSCRFCGFRSEKYQEVHHEDNDHTNNKPQNLLTSCPLCHQCHHVGLAGLDGRGVIIALPEVSQASLNRLLITLWIAKHKEGSPYKLQAERIIHQLKARAHIVETQFAEGASDPQLIAQLLIGADDKRYAERHKGLAGLRLMAIDYKFENQIAYWANETFSVLPFDSWASIWTRFDALRKEA